MRVLLSTIGTRGDVQPMVALALALREQGHDAQLCVPPDFLEWIEALGLPVTPVGPSLRSTAQSSGATQPTPEQRLQMLDGMVAAQFEVIGSAARGCDMIVGATTLQIAAPSIAERLGIPYVFAAYCPAAIPSIHHAPPLLTTLGDRPADAPLDHRVLWDEDARRWNDTWRDALNRHRLALDLGALEDVRSYILTEQPWLAADATLAPWPEPEHCVLQTGAWMLGDDRALPDDVEEFLDGGDPAIYFGLGSIRAPIGLAATMIQAARALGLRVIVSRGWADLSLMDASSDCLSIGDVNHRALFQRVAAVAHHGGAGTTTAAARAGVPQVVIPQQYDQFYWARRVHELGIGIACVAHTPTQESLTAALSDALRSRIAERARALAINVRTDAAESAARALVTQVG